MALIYGDAANLKFERSVRHSGPGFAFYFLPTTLKHFP